MDINQKLCKILHGPLNDKYTIPGNPDETCVICRDEHNCPYKELEGIIKGIASSAVNRFMLGDEIPKQKKRRSNPNES